VKKSLFTFGLLASSLVMLSVMPLLNNNSAMAQGYDIYRDNGYYSQYPTDDKKYECRTGPFEGFFVSSVEFCKYVKFDKGDRKDSRDNQTGIQGPPGPAGPQGPQGPPGITPLNATNFYSLNNSTSSDPLDPNESVLALALCDIGDFAISGGYSIIPDLAENDTVETLVDQSIQSLQPVPPFIGEREGWVVIVEANDESSELTLNMNVLCLDNPPLRP